MDFKLNANIVSGQSLIGFPTFKITEKDMIRTFGPANSPWSYCEHDKGYTGYWDFVTETGVLFSVGFRWGDARYSGHGDENIEAFETFLKTRLDDEFCGHGNNPSVCEVCHPELESDEDYEARMRS